MQFLQAPPLHPFTTPKTLPKPSFLPKPTKPSQNFPLFSSYVPEAPLLNEEFVAKFRPKGDETESEARHRNWKIHGWAPWEEILTPEADFAKKSLDEGEEVPLRTPEAIEAFKMLRPSYREKKRKEMGLTEDEYLEKQFEIKGEILEKYETSWAGPLVVRLVAPRDWPPRGWVVDREELEFIREGHKMMNERVDVERLDRVSSREEDEMGVERYKVFLKQYEEWVLHNKDRLEKESCEIDQDYHPGRRKRGKYYKEGMYELPFYYPGQICVGKVTTIHLYQGAFVDIGGVYEGWVPIKNNDWFWIRQYIKVNMQVIVEIVAKRDPYRFRFPIELRFLDPNIDHLIFNRFEFPPIFHRDTTPDELRRDSGRPPVTRKETSTRPEEDPLVSDHPYVDKLWQINAAEQMILNDMEANPHKYEGKKLSELIDDEEFDEENSVVYSKVRYKKSILPKVTLKTSVRDLDLESAFTERQHNKRLQKEAEERGEEFKVAKLRRHLEMDEYDLIHWRRSFEEREALIRDVSCRQALGLPLEEPGRYANARELLKGQYDPGSSLYRHDYWGEPKNSEKSKLMKLSDIHNKSIVGRRTLWYDMAYEDVIKQMEERKRAPREDSDEEDEVEDELDFDNSIFHKFISGNYDGDEPRTFFGNEDDPQVKWDD